jgi:hypothetical protein
MLSVASGVAAAGSTSEKQLRVAAMGGKNPFARMRNSLLKGFGVAGEHRNTTIVAVLIASMTLCAALLLWLEPPTRGWQASDLLMAADGQAVQSVTIQYAPPGAVVEPGLYDCIVFSDGQCDWRPRGRDIVMLVMGTPDDGLPRGLAQAVLNVLGNLSQGGRLDLSRVHLSPDSDPRLTAGLSPQANALFELLSRKGVLDR